MALARVQASAKATSANTASITFTMATPPSVGNALVVFVNHWKTGATVLTATDTHGNTYAQAVAQLNSPSHAAILYCPVVGTTGSPFQITIASGTTGVYWCVMAVEVSGVGAGLSVDQTTNTTNSSVTPSTGTTAALTGAEVFVAACHGIAAAQSTITVVGASPTWTQEFEELPFTFIAGEANTRVVTSAAGTTQTCSWTDTGFASWAGVLAAFKGAAPAAVATAESYVWGPL